MPDDLFPAAPPVGGAHSAHLVEWKCSTGHERVSWKGEPVCWFCGRRVAHVGPEVKPGKIVRYF